MRYALIMAGGSGTRLWPMSRSRLPKQLIPFIGGKSLLEIAVERLDGLVPADQRLVCAAQRHAGLIVDRLPGIGERQFLGEPCGRDTLNAVAFSAAVIARRDPEAVMAVFTADHVIEPVDRFLEIVGRGFDLVEQRPDTLVTFGIAPTEPATGYGYLELGKGVGEHAHIVDRFLEKPDADKAQAFFEAGPESYLWNSGMFVWKAKTLLDCVKRYQPENFAGVARIAEAWDTPERNQVLEEVYPQLAKISVDFAVMEPASGDASVSVAALPMQLQWLDVGAWPAFAETCPADENGNAVGAGRSALMDTRNTLVASSDPEHLISTIGCEDLIIIHTPDATLVCPRDRAQDIKAMHRQVGETFGEELV